MLCSVCRTENPAANSRCSSCGNSLNVLRSSRVRRRVGADEIDTAFTPTTNPANAAANRAFRVSLYAMIPVVGAVLGPFAVLLGVLALWRPRPGAILTAHASGYAAVVLGGLVTLTNWAGLTLIALSFR
jgi:hypothetical protein